MNAAFKTWVPLALLWLPLLAASWLIPYHFPPWGTFHADALWVLGAWLFGAFVWIRRIPLALHWNPLAITLLLLAAIPLLHWSAGLLPWFGQAWISAIYSFGAVTLLVLTASLSETDQDRSVAALFLAIIVASIVSVWLQLQTLLGLQGQDITDIWSMGLSGTRPYANIGQPNLLCSLLIWGMLAVAWTYERRHIGANVAVIALVFLLIGAALTQSRTGQISLTMILLLSWVWRTRWRSPQTPWVASGLFIAFWLALPAVNAILGYLLLDPLAGRTLQHEPVRLQAWQMFLHAIADRPWFGYGMTEVAAAQVEVADRLAPLPIRSIFAHAHNLPLDFLLWLGIPLGAAVIAVIAYVAITLIRKIRTAEETLLLFMVMVIGIHAMLELPLHHAFFLLPTCWILGVLTSRHLPTIKIPVLSTKPFLFAMWLACGAALGITVRDYLIAEEAYTAMRFEKARIGTNHIGVPDLLVLDQLQAWIAAGRYVAQEGMPPDQIKTLDALARRHPASGTMYVTAKAHALNGNPDRAQYWLNRICKLIEEELCPLLQQSWEKEAQTQPAMAVVSWPKP